MRFHTSDGIAMSVGPTLWSNNILEESLQAGQSTAASATSRPTTIYECNIRYDVVRKKHISPTIVTVLQFCHIHPLFLGKELNTSSQEEIDSLSE